MLKTELHGTQWSSVQGCLAGVSPAALAARARIARRIRRQGARVRRAGLQVAAGLGGGRVQHARRRAALPQRQLRGQVHRIGLRADART